MGYKLSVGNKVVVPVKFELADAGQKKKFSFTLLCTRLTDKEFQDGIKGEGDFPTPEKIRAQMLEITTGWENQTFVLDDDGAPAMFCSEALEVMFAATGVLDVVLKSYLKEVAAIPKI